MKIITLIRAICGLMARKTFIPIVRTFVIALIIILIIIALLASFVSEFWWWALLPIGVFTIPIGIIMAIVWIIIQNITPNISKSQRKEVMDFVQKVQSVAEVASTPKIVLLYKLITDMINPKKDGFLNETISNTTSLKRDFEKLLRNLGTVRK